MKLTDRFILSEKEFKITELKNIVDKDKIFITKGTLEADVKIKNPELLSGVMIVCEGKNNKVYIDENAKLTDCKIYLKGDNNFVYIGKNCKLNNAFFMELYNGGDIQLGDNVTVNGEFWGNVYFHASEYSKISVGNDCMFSGNIIVRTHDGHAILNKKGERINMPKDIKIGNHVWVGMNVAILKGTNLPNNTIVGANAVVTKKFECSEHKSIAVAGNPAKIIKEQEMYWVRKRGFDFTEEDYLLK